MEPLPAPAEDGEGSDAAAQGTARLAKVAGLPTSEKKYMHSQYYWVALEAGHESEQRSAEDVALNIGVPKPVLAGYLEERRANDESFGSLPFALFLIVIFGLMITTMDPTEHIHSMQGGIRFDIVENANFAFSAPGAMGHKALEDVNNFADFWSWMRLGLAPLVIKQSVPVSEPNDLNLGNFTVSQVNSYLVHNRLLGGIRVSRQQVPTMRCVDPELEDMFPEGCTATILDDTYQPNNLDLQTNRFQDKDDENETFWLLTTEGPVYNDAVLKRREAADWVNYRTGRVEASFMLYNGNNGLLVLTRINFVFSRAGHIWKHIGHTAMRLTQSNEALIYGSLFYLQILWIGLAEGWQVIKCIRTHRHHGFTHMARDYFKFWNLVDWASVAVAIVILLSYLSLRPIVQEVEDLVNNAGFHRCHESAAAKQECVLEAEIIFDRVQQGSEVKRVLRAITGWYPVIIMLRLFKAFEAQPRLAIVTSTLRKAFVDLVHFSIVFVAIWSTYAVMATVMFGNHISEFSGFWRSFMALYRALMGDIDFDAMREVGNPIAVVFYVSLTAIFVLVMFSMLVAIIMDVYSEVKKSSSWSLSLWDQAWLLWMELRENNNGKRVRLYMIEAEMEEHDPSVEHGHAPLSDFATSQQVITLDALTKLVIQASRDRKALASFVDKIFTKSGVISEENARAQANEIIVCATKWWPLYHGIERGQEPQIERILDTVGRIEHVLHKHDTGGHVAGGDPQMPPSLDADFGALAVCPPTGASPLKEPGYKNSDVLAACRPEELAAAVSEETLLAALRLTIVRKYSAGGAMGPPSHTHHGHSL